MQLEDYFDFLAPNDIRVLGTRVGLETILEDYLESGMTAERIAGRYPTLTLEQVYATLTYYWRNKEAVDAYLQLVDDSIEEQRRQQYLNPPPAIARLQKMLAERESTAVSSDV